MGGVIVGASFWGRRFGGVIGGGNVLQVVRHHPQSMSFQPLTFTFCIIFPALDTPTASNYSRRENGRELCSAALIHVS